MKDKVLYLLPAMVTAFLVIFSVGSTGGFGEGDIYLVLALAIASSCFVPVLAEIVERLPASVWITVGLFVLAGLCIFPPIVLVEHPIYLPREQQTLWTIVVAWLTPITIFTAAVLINSSLTQFAVHRKPAESASANPKPAEPEGARPRRYWSGGVALLLSGILLAAYLYNFYWLIIWDSAGDAINFLWLFSPLMSAIFAGAIILVTLPVRTRLAGLIYALLVPLLILTVYGIATLTNFRQLTTARAERVERAIQAYQAREGHYPQNLQQLIPRYLLSIPEPVIIYRQNWCYDGGDDYYRLGYVNRDHWSSPLLSGTIVDTQGQLPDLPRLCTQEVEELIAHWPNYYHWAQSEQ